VKDFRRAESWIVGIVPDEQNRERECRCHRVDTATAV
jgi:hypothetical protein